MKLPRKFPKRYVIYSIAVVYLFGDLVLLKGPLSRRVEYRKKEALKTRLAVGEGHWVATVNTRPLTRRQLDLATNIYLYRRGEIPEDLSEVAMRITRRAVMQQLVNDELVRQYAIAEKAVPDPGAVKRRSAVFRSQFENKEAFKERLAAQKLSEPELAGLIHDHVTQQEWLEKRISPAVEVGDGEAREWYEENRNDPEADGFSVPEIIRARHVFISTVEEDNEEREALIRDIYRQLTEEGGDFADLAQAYSEDERSKLQGGDLGWFSRRRMPEDFINFVFPLPKAEVSRPFRTTLGWHIAEIIDRKAARALSFEDLKPEIVALLKNRKRKAVLQIFLLKLRRASNIIIYPENF